MKSETSTTLKKDRDQKAFLITVALQNIFIDRLEGDRNNSYKRNLHHHERMVVIRTNMVLYDGFEVYENSSSWPKQSVLQYTSSVRE